MNFTKKAANTTSTIKSVTMNNQNLSQFELSNKWMQSDKPKGMKVRAIAVMAYLIACSSKNQKGNFTCTPSHKTIAAKCGMGVTTVKQGIADLEEAKLLCKYQRHDDSLVYTILFATDTPKYGKGKEVSARFKAIKSTQAKINAWGKGNAPEFLVEQLEYLKSITDEEYTIKPHKTNVKFSAASEETQTIVDQVVETIAEAPVKASVKTFDYSDVFVSCESKTSNNEDTALYFCDCCGSREVDGWCSNQECETNNLPF